MAVRLPLAQASTSECAAVRAGNVGLDPNFANEDQARRIESGLVLQPRLPALESVRAILLARVARFLLVGHPEENE